MGILRWDKPKKLHSTEEHNAGLGADGAPPGVHVPNMSAADVAAWKAKLVGTRTGYPSVEIRTGATVIVVSLGGGYKYKYYTPDRTQGINLHIASAGPMQWTFKDLEEMNQAIEEARDALERLQSCHG